MEGDASHEELRQRWQELNEQRQAQGLKPRSYRDFLKSRNREGRRTRLGLAVEDYSVENSPGEGRLLPPGLNPPPPRRDRTAPFAAEQTGEVASASAQPQQEATAPNTEGEEASSSWQRPEQGPLRSPESARKRRLEAETEEGGQAVRLRSASAVRRDAAGEEEESNEVETQRPYDSHTEGPRPEASSGWGDEGPSFHAAVEREANRRNVRLMHHLMGSVLVLYRSPLSGALLPRPAHMRMEGKGNQRIAYSFGSYVLKVTTFAYDHGSEEYYSTRFTKLCAIVVHAGPLNVRIGQGARAEYAVLHCLVHEKVNRKAEPWLNAQTPAIVREWFSYLLAVVTWLGACRVRVADITISNLGLNEDHDLGSWSSLPYPQWGGGSGLERLLAQREPELLRQLKARTTERLQALFEHFASQAGRLLREAGRLPGPASARTSAGASRRSSGFFFRRSSDVSRKQLEALQAQLAVILSDRELRDSSVLQDFLGVPAQAPEMPSSVRIVNLRRCHDGEAEVQLEVQTSPEKALVEGRTSATHVVATVLLLRPKGAEEELEEIGDFKVPAGSSEPLTIHGLGADRAYEFQVKTVNDVGSSPSVRIRVLVPTDLPEPVLPYQGASEVVPSKAVLRGAADFLGNVPADTSLESTADTTELPPGPAQASGDKPSATDTSTEAPASLHQEANGDADKPAVAEAAVVTNDTVLPVPAAAEMPAPDTSAEASCSEPSAAKDPPADGLAQQQEVVVEQQASGDADKPAVAEAAVARNDTVLPVPVPAEVEAADAVDTAAAEMPAPDTSAEASCSEPSAAKDPPADGLAQQQAGGEANKLALVGQQTAVPGPLPAQVEEATVEMSVPDTLAEASRNGPSAAKETSADGLASLQQQHQQQESVVEQQASGEADKPTVAEAAVASHDPVLPVPVPAEVEAADAVDTAAAEMPAPDTSAEASSSEPSAAKDPPADGLAQQQAGGEANKPALVGQQTAVPGPLPAQVEEATVEMSVPDTLAEASRNGPSAAKETSADGLASLQQQHQQQESVVEQQASGEADKPTVAEAAVASHDPVLPVPVPAEVEAADAVDTAAAEMPAPDTSAEASSSEPSATKDPPADGLAQQQASGDADKPALAEAAVARHDPVLPVPVPAEVEAADAVDTAAAEMPAPDTSAEASSSEPSAAKDPPADGLAQQQAGGEANKPALVGQQTAVPGPLPAQVEEATVEMSVPDTLAEASRNGPSAAKETSADGLASLQQQHQQQESVVEQQASGEADKPTVAEAAVASHDPVLPVPVPAEVESADAVDIATAEMPAPDTSAEASSSEPSAAKETPADGPASLQQQQEMEGSKTEAIAESLSNGQPQKLDPARLKLKEGDPYLSPHARALVNDEEGATFLNSAEEVRSPQRESSARSLQPPSAGFARVGTLEVRLSQLPDKKAVGAAMDEAVAHLEAYYKVSEQTAVRLYLGCNLDMEEAKRRFDGILEWRKQYGVDQMRQGLLSALHADEPVMVPFHKEVAKLVTINPCALTSAEGSPVSIYHVGTAHSSAAPKADEDQLRRFGVFVAEYVDVWLSAQTTTTGKLAGHVQIYDLQGLSLWQVSSGALVEKLKILLGAGQHYMEQVSQIFVIRSSSAFSMAWNFIKGWISPRTASKIHVSSSIPSELQKLLGPSAAALPALLKNPQWTAAVQRPPFSPEE
ncbi:SFH9 [Symbiodinium sp. CCMP2592]|nr:SFH9 [Symbiodinium sp. CCMP2592]